MPDFAVSSRRYSLESIQSIVRESQNVCFERKRYLEDRFVSTFSQFQTSANSLADPRIPSTAG